MTTTAPSAPIGLIIACHGLLAEGLVEACGLIWGQSLQPADQTPPTQKTFPVHPFSLVPGEEPKHTAKRLKALVKKCDKGRGVIVMVDMLGGTPASLALALMVDKQVEVITGVNLPMVLTAVSLDLTMDLKTASDKLAKTGRLAIHHAGDLLSEG
ncbi:MAG: PTS sugar transporter subunit IIA [Deltaproteobacteria bacterium]|nr:PTS sugar transporter subunit IIA [Deltaproteobacteria bacterium]